MTTQRLSTVITILWLLLLSLASISHVSEALSLSTDASCSPSVTDADIWCAAADSPGMSTLLTNITVEIDCSQPNQITVHYPDIIEQDHHDITTTYELLLNCSNETESFCLLYNFDTNSGPYILRDEGQNVILPGSTCIVSTCFTTDAYEPYFRTPPISCRHPPDSTASLTTNATVTTTTVPTDTYESTGQSSIATTPTKLPSSVITTTTLTGKSSIAATPATAEVIAITNTPALAGGKPIITPTLTTKHSRLTTGTVTVSSSFTIDHEAESLEQGIDMKQHSGIILLLLPIMLGTAIITVLMLMVSVWIWYLKSRRNRNKIFFVYNKNDMVFDPLHAPAISVETPTAFQHDKMSVFSMDVLQSLNPINQIPLWEQTEIIPIHSSDINTSIPDPNCTDKCHYKSNISHDQPGSQSIASEKTPTEGGDSEEETYISIHGQSVTTHHMTCTLDSESALLNEKNHKQLTAMISLDDSAIGSDDFSIHTPISSPNSLPGVSYCQFKSQCVKHYNWNSSPYKTMQKERETDLDEGLQDCMTSDDFSENLTDARQDVHTVIHSDLTESRNTMLPFHVQIEKDFKSVLSEKDVDNEQKVTDPPFMLSEDSFVSMNEEKTQLPCSSPEYIQSHVHVATRSWNVKQLTDERDHFEDDVTLDLITCTECDQHSEHSIDQSFDVYRSPEHFPSLHFVLENEVTQSRNRCRQPLSNNKNSDMKLVNHLSDELSNTCTGRHVDLQPNDTTMRMLDDNTIDHEADGVHSISIIERCNRDSHCSSNESGYYGYIPSFDPESSNGNILHTTIADLDSPPLDMTLSQ